MCGRDPEQTPVRQIHIQIQLKDHNSGTDWLRA